MDPSELRVSTTELFGPRLVQLARGGVAAAGLGLLLMIGGAFTAGGAAFQSYLFGFLFLWGVTNGALGWLMIHHTAGGGWSFLLRRLLEAAASLAPLLVAFFLPVAFGIPCLYSWSHPTAELAHALKDKLDYLDVRWFLIRSAGYLAFWWILSYLLRHWGARQDRVLDLRNSRRLAYLSAAGLVAQLIVTTFAGVDWVMTLTPRWSSSIFGALVFAAQGLTALSALLVLLGWLAGDRPLLRDVPSGYYRDLGNLLLAALMFWAYLSFSQYLLIYVGDLADEIGWYVDRSRHGWEWVSLALVFGDFLLPALVLIVGSRIKRSPRLLAWVAGYLVLGRLLDLFWWVVPTFRSSPFVLLSDLGAPLLLGGVWLWFFARALRDRPVVPRFDPRLLCALEEAREHA